MKNDIPKLQERYRHLNGNEYTVIMLANLDSARPEYPITIVYQGCDGKVWAKDLNNFYKKMSRV